MKNEYSKLFIFKSKVKKIRGLCEKSSSFRIINLSREHKKTRKLSLIPEFIPPLEYCIRENGSSRKYIQIEIFNKATRYSGTGSFFFISLHM